MMLRVGGELALLLTLGSGLGTDQAQARDSGATLYEVTETIQFNRVQGITFRHAVATLMGAANIGTPLCPTKAQAPTCTVTGVGRDDVSLVTGRGSVSGTFAVVINGPGNSSVHVPDLPVLTGTFQGDIDMSPAIVYGMPLGSIRGKFTVDQGGQVLPFSGTFRLPFALDENGEAKEAEDADEAAYYLGDDYGLIPVKATERTLGFPCVRLEVRFDP